MQALPRRRTVVVVAVLGLVPFFGGVSALVKSARMRRQQIATDWAARGDRDNAAGLADRAADDYRSAQQFARDSNAYRLQLANALLAGNHLNEARGQLLALWAEAPADAIVNLQLGRIAAHQGDTPEALRFYHAAIDGAWPRDAAASRRNARLELAKYLMRQHDLTKAQAELIALIDDLPPDAGVMTETADLLLASGTPQRAITVLDKALTLDPHNARALQLAGEAAFELADYRTAARYFNRAASAGPLDGNHEHLRILSARVLAMDPFARGISSRERVRRIVAAVQTARASLDRCPSDALPDLRGRLEAALPTTTEPVLARDPDAVDDALALVTDIEAATAVCGAANATDDDAALRLVLKQHRASS
jgi:tetratricopeptide (TPR) repeat protein